MYYENYIIIEISIPNFEEIKKKYFDSYGNKLLILNNEFQLESPFEYFTPVMYADPSGNFAISLTLLGLITGAVIGAAAGGTIAYNVAKNNGKDGWELFGWTLLGALGGGIIGGALGAGVGVLVTHTTGIIGLSITKYSILPIKATTILGTMPGYIGAATASGSGYYLISNKLWYSMSAAERWYNNSTYIRDANKLGSQFSIFAEKVPKEGSTLLEELQYLIEHNIPWSMF